MASIRIFDFAILAALLSISKKIEVVAHSLLPVGLFAGGREGVISLAVVFVGETVIFLPELISHHGGEVAGEAGGMFSILG